MDWRTRFADKLITPEGAAALVENGMRVGFGISAGSAPTIEAALVARAPELKDIEVGPIFPRRHSPVTAPALAGVFHRWCILTTPAVIDQVHAGAMGVAPPLWGLARRLEESGRRNPHAWDVFFVRTSPPDADGNCSFGTCVWYSKLSCRSSARVVLEIDENVPRPCGDNTVNIRDAAHVVEHAPGVDYVPPSGSGEKADLCDVIGAYAATLVRDGDTIQIGGGMASAAVMNHLEHHHDLGYHAEYAEEGLIDLVEAGIINGARKEIHRGQAVMNYMQNTERAKKAIDGNPAYGIYGVDYVNDPAVILQHSNFVALNTAASVDLTGQSTSESLGGRPWNGPGGQLEFVIGAMLSKGGRSIVCVPSRTVRGESRILTEYQAGTVVTMPRAFADYVVTEYGIAALMGKTERQRADELIAIAHPDFRGELRTWAAQRFGNDI